MEFQSRTGKREQDASMETLRLRRIQEPSRVERLLEAYISRTGNLPEDSYQVRDPRELPGNLQLLLTRAIEDGNVWSCWARGPQVWLFTCHVSLDLSRERGAPVIVVHLYGEDAELTDTGAWRFDPLGNWTRCAD
jgi:hypothetical protein